jgi:ER-bound oxygenase mpaB/B'/Rubber oxygenase, catalytic domain
MLDELRRAGDPSADAVIGELAHTQQIRAVSRILRHLVDNDQPIPAELPPSIARWLEQTAELPSWVERDRFERGCRLVVEHGPQVCVVLATASLVYCYAGYPGVNVLTFGRRLDHDAVRRVGETAQFVLEVMAPGSLDAGGRGVRKIQKVRLLHAAIRYLVTTSRRWDLAGDGVPICQEDLAGTLMSFSSIVVDTLHKLGVRVDEDEAEDYYYRWRVIGQMLGINPAAIPIDLAAARELTDLIAQRNHRRSEEGIEMAGGRSASFSIPVPRELERRWTASGVFPAIDNELIQFARAQPA